MSYLPIEASKELSELREMQREIYRTHTGKEQSGLNVSLGSCLRRYRHSWISSSPNLTQ
jgi:hypothetical protein